MIPRELIKKIRYIQIYTSKAVNDILAGEYHSVFKGQGMEFDEVRAYQPGDDIRTIDWNVTARTGHPYVKRYVEEREITVFFLVDLSASGVFGCREKLKNEIAAEFCALLAFSAIKNNDKVGLIVFTDTVEMFIPPAKGTSHVLRLIRELLYFDPVKKRQRTGTDIALALRYLGRVLHKRGVVFLVSDFHDRDFEKPLGILARRHDLIAVTVTDPCEHTLPDVGLLEIQDAETGASLLIDSGSEQVRNRYEQLGNERDEWLGSLFRSIGVDRIQLFTDRDYVLDLVSFFRKRMKKQ
ncbi:MAG: DUF58 domain-containing protein [Desulfobulbales bacterium]|nr:DUF58 domain-containing protein [Desulfobulbales bacterium]